MDSLPFDSSCTFCRKFGAGQGTRWYDKELTRSGPFLITPGLGPLAEGYLLILPVQHYSAISQIPQDCFKFLKKLKDEATVALTRLYGDVVIFEHGSASETNRAGACIDHAHLHLLPIAHDLLPRLSSRFELEKLADIEELCSDVYRHNSYILFENQARVLYVALVKGLPSQYFRRVIAEELGVKDFWDYGAFPGHESIRATLQKLNPWPANGM